MHTLREVSRWPHALLIGLIVIAVALAFAYPHNAYAGGSSKAGKSKPASVSITSYTETKTFDSVTADYRYDLPVVKGKSKAVKKMNKSMAKDYKSSLEDKERLMIGAEQYAMQIGRASHHFFLSRAKVTYNKNGYLSIRHENEWYAGGVHNGWTTGDTFLLKTGKRLSVSKVLSGNAAKVKKKIAKAYIKKIGQKAIGREEDIRQTILNTKIGDFNYYLKKGKVVVCFGPYSPGIGNGQVKVTLKGNYAK